MGNSGAMEDEQPIAILSTAEPAWQNTCARLVDQGVPMRIQGIAGGVQRSQLHAIAEARGAKVIYSDGCAFIAP